MKTSQTILSVLSLVALGATALLAACGSSDDTTVPVVIKDAGTAKDATTPATDSGSPVTDAGTPPTTDAGSVVDSGCDSRVSIRVRDAGGLYCFKGGIDAGAYCQEGETCCVSFTDAGARNACTTRSACDLDAGAARKYECTQASDCTGGQKCCALGATEQYAQCSYDWAKSGHKGTACQASCGAGQAPVCTSNSDCPTGTTCRPATIFGTFMGVCR